MFSMHVRGLTNSPVAVCVLECEQDAVGAGRSEIHAFELKEGIVELVCTLFVCSVSLRSAFHLSWCFHWVLDHCQMGNQAGMY